MRAKADEGRVGEGDENGAGNGPVVFQESRRVKMIRSSPGA